MNKLIQKHRWKVVIAIIILVTFILWLYFLFHRDIINVQIKEITISSFDNGDYVEDGLNFIIEEDGRGYGLSKNDLEKIKSNPDYYKIVNFHIELINKTKNANFHDPTFINNANEGFKEIIVG